MTTIRFTLPRPPTSAEQALIKSWWAERGHDVTITLLSPDDAALAERWQARRAVRERVGVCDV